MPSKKKHLSVDEIEAKIKILAEINKVAVQKRFAKLRQGEVEQLNEEIVKFTNSIPSRLDQLQKDNECGIIEKIERIEDIKVEIEREQGHKTFHRDIGPIEKTIWVSDYYSKPLKDALCELCNAYEGELKDWYNRRNTGQKLREITTHVLSIPVYLMSKSTSRYVNAVKYIDMLTSESNDGELIDILNSLKCRIEKIRKIRTITFWVSIIPTIGVFIFYSVLEGAHYKENVLIPLLGLFLSYLIYYAFFGAVMEIAKYIIFRGIEDPEDDF